MGSRRSPLSNRLVVVVPASSPLAIDSVGDLAGPSIRRLALAHPEAVPAGEGPAVSYALAAMADRPHRELVRRVVDWLTGPQAAAVYARHGFVVVTAAP